MRTLALTFCLIGSLSLLAGCDALGIETATQIAAKKEAEARAIGSACRHAVRSIEDCFNSHPRAGKAAVFAGWREMDEYMRENAIMGMPGTPSEASEAAPSANPSPENAPAEGRTPASRSS